MRLTILLISLLILSGCAGLHRGVDNLMGYDRNFTKVCDFKTDPIHEVCIVPSELDVPQVIEGQLLPASVKHRYITLDGSTKYMYSTITIAGHRKKDGNYYVDWPRAYEHEKDHVWHAMGKWYNPDKPHPAKFNVFNSTTTRNVLWR